MADARIEIELGSFKFSGEGSEKWVGEQLVLVLERVPGLVNTQFLVALRDYRQMIHNHRPIQ